MLRILFGLVLLGLAVLFSWVILFGQGPILTPEELQYREQWRRSLGPQIERGPF